MSSKNMQKMGTAKVSLIQLDGVNCVLKQGASDVEVNFYKYAAEFLQGVNSPRLLKVDGCDLFIEHIPNSISLSKLKANPNTYELLARLHTAKYLPNFPVKSHQWDILAKEKALRILSLPNDANSAIASIQSISSCIFEPQSIISGDTNDGNWGARSNGDLVLFDWERFGYGSPAIDLAPLVNSLGSMVDYHAVIGSYMAHCKVLSKSELLRHVIIAKCWIIIEVVNILIDRDNPEAPKYIDWYRKNVPQWLASVKHAL
ncbi:phosphotransferase family protein [Vibrio parahaemolyticus]